MSAASSAKVVPLPGDVVAGKYRVERVLGSGGMGIVVAARDERTGADVAVKLLRPGSEQKSLERFLREARTMSRLASPHLVRVLDVGSDATSAFLVMERLHGSDLSDLAKRKGVIPIRDVADYMIQACEALSHAHANGIVHRDVKPSNLFVHNVDGGREVLKVLDFGISKVLSTDDQHEHTLTSSTDGGVLGSPPYMSPEQIRDPKTVDSRTDIWSLGILMYRLLGGALPFEGESVGEVFARILERRFAPLRTVASIPPELDALVERCMARDRRDRFAHVGELALALAPFASPEHAASALAIAERMHNEARTLEEVSADRPKRGSEKEPSTMTADHPPHLAPGSGLKVIAANVVNAPISSRGEIPTSDGISSSSSLAPPSPSPQRSRLAFVLIGLGVAAGLALGFFLRAPRPDAATTASAPPPSTVAIPEPPPTAATATAPASASATGAPTATGATGATAATAPAHASSTPVHTAKAEPRRGGGGKKPPGSTPSSPTNTTTSPAVTARPELQPSPYGAP